MSATQQKAAGSVIVELLDGLRVARGAGGLLLEHAEMTAELLQLDWQQERLRLRQVVVLTLFEALLLAIVLLHASALAMAAAWNTPYRLYTIGVALLLFAAAAGWCRLRLRRLASEGERQFADTREQLHKTIELLRHHL